MKEIEVRAIIEEGCEIAYAKIGDAGMDLKANIQEPITLKPLERALIPTGVKIALPAGTEAQVRPRSGMAYKHGISVLNTPGTIDEGYRGDIGVIAVNLSNEEYTIQPKERIAQLVFKEYLHAKINIVDTLDETDRGTGGFGHTGK
jgi:dUTP pyrophosphatase